MSLLSGVLGNWWGCEWLGAEELRQMFTLRVYINFTIKKMYGFLNYTDHF